ncbi:MAG: biosynthetic-type acetolactate synthase large subunit [Candidatus Methanomethylophilaceae archaeon]|nr:biosynthetic-type acetolactate synthase large subunit [Candidatus Methanomethylophilaceae archaeon]
MKGSRALLKMLEDRGVGTIFGYPGGTVIPIYNEMLDSSIRHVLVRHEQCAAHMADGYSRASGRTGVCLATSGPGTTNLVTGVGTAFADSIPMMVLTGQVATGNLGMGAFQEVDAFSLMMPVTKYNYRVLDLNLLPSVISEGWKVTRLGRPGPVHVDLPIDAMNSQIDESLLTQIREPRPVQIDTSGIPTAIQWIKEAKRPIILAGGGIIGSDSSEDMVRLAERIGAGVLTPLMGMGSIPYDHPLAMGSLGMHGRRSALSAMKEADLIIAAGTKFSDRTYSPHTRPGNGSRIIHIDLDSTEFNKHGLTSINIKADVGDVLRTFLYGLEGFTPDPAWTMRLTSFKSKCCCDFDYDGVPIKPQKVMREINKLIDDETIVTTDVGQNQMWAMHCLNIKRPRQMISSGGFGTMGFGLPSAIGAKAACPDKKVLTVTGDGGLLMVVQELATAIQEDLPVTICLMNNGWLGMVRQWQKLFWSKRYSATKLYDSNPDFVKLAEAFGANGIRIERPSEIGDALKRSMNSGETCLIDIHTDPEEDVLPMLPPDPAIPMVKGRCPY